MLHLVPSLSLRSHAFHRSVVINSSPSPAVLGQVQALSWGSVPRHEPHGQKLLGWDVDPMHEMIFNRAVGGLTDLVYKRLLSKPGIYIPPVGTARTLPDDASINQTQPELPQVARDLMYSAAPNSTTIPFSDIQAPDAGLKRTEVIGKFRETTEYHPLADDLDEYLQALGLDPLTEAEAQYTKEMEGLVMNRVDSRPLFLDAPRVETPVLSTTLQPRDEGLSHPWCELATEKPTSQGSGDTSERQSDSRRRGRFSIPFDFKVDPLSVVGLAASILTMVSRAAKLSRTTAHTYGTFGISSDKLFFLSRSLYQYSNLLEAASDILLISRAGALQRMGETILHESQTILEEAQSVLSFRHVSRSKAWYNGLKWLVRRDKVMKIIEMLDSLKPTLSIMLQLHSVQAAGQSTRMIEATSARVELLCRNMNRGGIAGE